MAVTNQRAGRGYVVEQGLQARGVLPILPPRLLEAIADGQRMKVQLTGWIVLD